MQTQEWTRPDALFQPSVNENGVVRFVAQIRGPGDPDTEPDEQQQHHEGPEEPSASVPKQRSGRLRH